MQTREVAPKEQSTESAVAGRAKACSGFKMHESQQGGLGRGGELGGGRVPVVVLKNLDWGRVLVELEVGDDLPVCDPTE